MTGRVRVGLALVVIAGGALVAAMLSRHPVRATHPAAGEVKLPYVGPRVTVEVLNAGGTRGAARDATGLLRRDGFDVVYFGNANTFGQDSSLVLDRVHDMAKARAVAEALGIRDVRSEPDSTLYVDVSVMLGRRWILPATARPPARDAGNVVRDPRVRSGH